MKVRFIFVGEGGTDLRLVPLIRVLCILCGADEVSGIAPDFRRLPFKPEKTVASQVGAALTLEPGADFVFVHRDADSRSAQHRYDEIEKAAAGVPVPLIPIVPIQETEAWLLLDEQAIRDVAGNPKGKVFLGLPKPSRVESTTSPKELLKSALAAASELSGRRLEKFQKEFGLHRSLLFDRIDVHGPITQLSAWDQLVRRIRAQLTQ